MSRLLTVVSVLMLACGGAGQEPARGGESAEDLMVEMTAEDMALRAVLSRGELTTAVNEKRYRATAPVATEFKPTEKVIYLVGRLKRVPTDSAIEVRWFLDATPEAMLVSQVQGSDRYQFVASFRPTEEKFERGTYTARVYVNDREVGAVPFLIEDERIALAGPKVQKVRLSKRITSKNKAKRPSTHFSENTQRLYVTFGVDGADYNTIAEVHWLHGDEPFHTEDVVLTGDRRYAANIEAFPSLPRGAYNVKIAIEDMTKAQESFLVGRESEGATIDMIELGTSLEKNNMPGRPQSTFDRNTPVIQCGLRFFDMPPNTAIELHWIQIGEDGETVIYKNRSNLAAGGSGTMGAAWEPTDTLAAGEYKVVILVNEEVLAEEPFEVE